MKYILEYCHRSDRGPRRIGPFDSEDDALTEANWISGKIMAEVGRWDCSYSVVPLAAPTMPELTEGR